MTDTFTPGPDLIAENAALQRELARYRAMVEQLTQGAYVYRLEDRADDSSLRIVAANPAAGSLTGAPPDSFLGRTIDECFPTLRAQGLPQAYAEVVRSGTPFETRVIHREEQVIAIAFTVRALPLPNDEVAVLFENITERARAEEALDESQHTLQTIIDSLPSAVFWKDRNSVYQGCNLANARSAGLASPAEIVGKTDYDLPWKPEEADFFREYDRRVMDAGAPELHIIEPIRTAGGQERWIDTSKVPLRDRSGQVIGILGTYMDVTEQRQTQEALRESQHRLQTIIDSLPSAVFWKDRDSIYQGCNLTFARFAGVGEPAGIVGKSDHDLPWAGPEADSFRAYDRKVMDSGVPELHIIETQLQADGRQSWADTNKIPLRDQSGAVIGILGTYEDITEQRRVQQALHESQELLQTLFDHLPMAVILKAAGDGRFVFWNQASERLYGLSAEQVIGKTDYDFFPKEVADGLGAKNRAVFELREPDITPEETFHSPLGDVTVRTTRLPIYDEQGEPAYLLIFCTDVTQQKLAAEERAALQAQVIEAQQHALRELSTPLLPLSDKVVLMPIIGTVDSRRAQQVMEILLQGVSAYNAQIAIVDITGVQVVDTQVANAFIQSAQAVQLLGARVILTGIRPEVAQTLVQLGVDLQGMVTRGSLQAGIASAFSLARG